jgi:hypothetical protein
MSEKIDEITNKSNEKLVPIINSIKMRKNNNVNELPRSKLRGIEDFFLKSLCMRGNKSPAPPVRSAPRGGVLNPKGLRP